MRLKKALERMLNKMKNDSKSGLKVQQIIGIVITLVIMSTNVYAFIKTNQNIQLANNKNEEIEQNTVEQIAEATQELEVEATTRSAEERIVEEQKEEINYITIEEIEISRNMDLTKRCGISKEDFKTLMTNLRPDTTGFFEDNSDTIYDLCEKYELNEIFFCGLIAAESGWKISSNHRNANNYISMMSNGKLIKYSTPEEGLEAAAKLLHNRYLTEGGSYYCGKTLSCVQKRFCPNSSTWVNLVYGCMNVIV